jgi:uncharacterized membrane protein YebE (DUF533 family)
MGFLDRMLADLIADSTGLPVRRLVRRVGARNLLLLGGAALAGGALAHAASRDRSDHGPTTPPPGVAPPPPLPPPGVAPPPPPPPPPPEAIVEDPSDDLPAELAFALVRAMVSAALADGELAEPERRAIHDRLAESNLTPEQVAHIRRDLVVPPSPDEFTGLVDDPSHRLAVYRAAVLVVHADREVAALEREWLERLADALGLDARVQHHVLRELESFA